MATPARRADALQTAALRAGAVLDGAFAAAMLATPEHAARVLGLTLPEPHTWFHLCGVLLAILAGAHALAAALEPRARHRFACVAGPGRLAGCAVLLGAWWRGEGLAFLGVGLADGALGAAFLALAGLAAARARGT